MPPLKIGEKNIKHFLAWYGVTEKQPPASLPTSSARIYAPCLMAKTMPSYITAQLYRLMLDY